MTATEKEIAVESVKSASPDEENATRALADPNWNPGFFKRFPGRGFIALVVVLICLVGEIVVLVASDGQSRTKWPESYQPSVILNLLNSVANIMFGVAIAKGVAIAWWRKASKGADVRVLHHSWQFTSSIGSVLQHLKHFNVIALATLTAKMTIIDGALMQRASTTRSALDPPVQLDNITGFANETFPVTGWVMPESSTPALLTHWLGDTLKMWSQTPGDYPNQWSGCDGVCFVEIPAAGFAIECDDETTSSIDYGKDATAGATPLLFQVGFMPHYETGEDANSYLNMTVLYTQANDQDGTCPGTLYQQTCQLRPAVISYPVKIQNSTATSEISVGVNHEADLSSLTLDASTDGWYNQTISQLNGYKVLRYLNIAESHVSAEDDSSSSLAGLELGFDMYISGNATLTRSNGSSYTIDQMGHSANYLSDPPQTDQLCSFKFFNPINPYHAPNGLFSVPGILARINQITFGLATDVSQDDPSNDHSQVIDVSGTLYKTEVHYRTHYGWMIGAICSTLICILFTLPAYYGFWQLGRDMDFSPLEMARAFRSPVTAQASNVEAAELVKEVGDQKVKYGYVASGPSRGILGVAEPQNVQAAHPSFR